MTTNPPRRFDKNGGYIALPKVSDDKYIAGVAVVLIDEAGNYSTEFFPESMDAVPTPEVQEALGGMLAQAYELANLIGTDR